MSETRPYKVAIVWRGDRDARINATPQNNRFHRIFEELAALGIHAEPAVYDEEFADEVREQLLAADGVLVWVDPIHQGKTREALDPLLREVAARGPWVSAHPDVILKMGVKEILYRTKHLGWGTDTHLYRSAAEFHRGLPATAADAGPRVLKQNRGNGGQGVWKVELVSPVAGEASVVRVLHAQRGSMPEELPLGDFMDRCESYFGWGGCIIDQPFQPRLPEGMIRCYMGADKVVGFGHQLIKALIPPPPEGPDSPAAQPGPRIMHGPDAAPFQALRARMEDRVDAADDAGSGHRCRRRCRSSGTPISFMAHAMRRAPTAMCFARSMSAPASRSRTKRPQQSRNWCWPGATARRRDRDQQQSGEGDRLKKTVAASALAACHVMHAG